MKVNLEKNFNWIVGYMMHNYGKKIMKVMENFELYKSP